ncbi:MAG: adenylyltransferase [Patescibacteria group bacterium]|nr:HIT family protein [Candidatus Saccharibacteria bacterium]MDQ5963411.1 adenylyltransferase [Patescibacteria group bacterium]
MSSPACPFCLDDERIVRENELAKVILSNPRKTAGHMLVIPKRHIEQPWELSSEELSAVFELIFAVQKKVIGILGDGCDIRQNYRPFMSQSRLKVDHVHFHVIPRSFEGYIYQVSEKYETDLFTELGQDEQQQVMELVKG